jgi:hypothetical protein
VLEVVATAWAGTTELAYFTLLIDNQLGFADVPFLIARVMLALGLSVTGPLDGLLGGINNSG